MDTLDINQVSGDVYVAEPADLNAAENMQDPRCVHVNCILRPSEWLIEPALLLVSSLYSDGVSFLLLNCLGLIIEVLLCSGRKDIAH